MKPKTEEFLYLLLWTCESLARPTWRNVTSSFEGWAYRNGLLRQLQELEQRHLIERQTTPAEDARLCRLSAAGRLYALGGRDPEERWNRAWDGKWRLILFDVPLGRDSHRDRLRRYLRGRNFGYLQNSVWISPDALTEERTIIEGDKASVESLIFLEARPCGGESDADIVTGAWDFVAINRRYARYMDVLSDRPENKVRTTAEAKAFRQWAERERDAWWDAVSHDPLLPKALLPSAYEGERAWRNRRATGAKMAAQIRDFTI